MLFTYIITLYITVISTMNNNHNSSVNYVPIRSETELHQTVTISNTKCICSVINLFTMSYLAIIFTRELLQLDKSVASMYKSKLLICYAVSFWLFTIRSFTDVLINFSVRGQTMLELEYQKMLSLNKKSVAIFYALCGAYNMVICFLIICEFVPFTKKSCTGYSDNMCFLVRCISVCSVIVIIVFGLIMLCFAIFLYMLNRYRSNDINNEITNNANNINERDYLLNLLFINITVFDIDCVICAQNGTDSNNSSFTNLNCGHKYHTECLQSWINHGSNFNCPTCRKPLREVLDIENETVSLTSRYQPVNTGQI